MPLVVIQPWADADLSLLRRMNTPALRKHVGGPDTEEQLLARHRRFAGFLAAGQGCMFSIRLRSFETPVGSVGYAKRTWQNELILRDELGGAAGVSGQGHRGPGRGRRRSPRGQDGKVAVAARFSINKEPGVERGLPPCRIRAGG